MATKADIAVIARKMWGRNEADRREGRQTVRAVLENYAKLQNRRRRRKVLKHRRTPILYN